MSWQWTIATIILVTIGIKLFQFLFETWNETIRVRRKSFEEMKSHRLDDDKFYNY